MLVSPKRTLGAILEEEAKQLTGGEQKRHWIKCEKLKLFCVQTCEQELGHYNMYTAMMYNNLGKLYSKMGKTRQAEELIIRALNIEQAILGPLHKSVARSNNCLANLYFDLQQYERAEQHYLNSINIRMELIGPGDPGLLCDYSGLIRVYRKLELHERKEEVERRQKEFNNISCPQMRIRKNGVNM